MRLLEPSVGDGSFVQALNRLNWKNDSEPVLTAIDLDINELTKARQEWNFPSAKFTQCDFLSFNSNDKYAAVFGNPPYIRKNRLSKDQLDKCKYIHFSEQLSDKSIKNIWTSFVVKSTRMLRDDGILSFVLPSELLQVKFAEEIRDFLLEHFEKLEIFTFSNLLFESIGQDTVALIAYKQSAEKGVFYSNIEFEEQLTKENFTLERNDALINSNFKWNHHSLRPHEIRLIEHLRTKLETIGHYCISKPGVVTAANGYFIINEETATAYELTSYTVPIIQKGFFVNGSVVFDQRDYAELGKKNRPSKLIRFTDEDKETFSVKVREYLKIGEDQKLPDRYKCKLRDNWFVIPNVSTESEGFFFKRSHHYPKLLKNSAGVFVTDSAYKIDMKDSFDINSLIYSFYNSLTLSFAEIEGRYYGGGVLELTPTEFRKLPLPYSVIGEADFESFRREFEGKENIETILEKNDFAILNESLGLSATEIGVIRSIRKKLVNKRHRKILDPQS